MTVSISVVVATYGDQLEWQPYIDRAKASAWEQTIPPLEVIHFHGETLARARNSGAEKARGEWIVFLDADDELDENYVEAMASSSGDVRRPSTLGIENGQEDDYPVMIPRKPLLQANFIVIGAMVERERFLRLGGFDELPVLEDWDLFIRFAIDGAEIVDTPKAIYKVHVRTSSRNQDQSTHGYVYSHIRQKYAGRLL